MKNILTFSLVIFLLSSCGNSNEKMIKGYKSVQHNNTGGALPDMNDFVHFHLNIYDDKKNLLQSVQDENNLPVIQIVPEEQSKDASNPILNLISNLAIGDSASLFIPIDSIPNPSPEMKETSLVEYVVTPMMMHTEEEYKAWAQKIVDDKVAVGEKAVKDYLNEDFDGQIIDLENGFKVYIIEEGEGEHPTAGQNVAVDYTGYLRDMTNFDNSYKRGRPFTFRIGQGMVIQGWDKGIPFLKPGGKAILDVPYALGYGAAGSPPSIPAESDLIFYVELLGVQ